VGGAHASDGRLLAYFLAFESFAVVALIICQYEAGHRHTVTETTLRPA
jgi:hypothetical protein